MNKMCDTCHGLPSGVREFDCSRCENFYHEKCLIKLCSKDETCPSKFLHENNGECGPHRYSPNTHEYICTQCLRESRLDNEKISDHEIPSTVLETDQVKISENLTLRATQLDTLFKNHIGQGRNQGAVKFSLNLDPNQVKKVKKYMSRNVLNDLQRQFYHLKWDSSFGGIMRDCGYKTTHLIQGNVLNVCQMHADDEEILKNVDWSQSRIDSNESLRFLHERIMTASKARKLYKVDHPSPDSLPEEIYGFLTLDKLPDGTCLLENETILGCRTVMQINATVDSLTAIHLEDAGMLSINVLGSDGQKIWIVIDPSPLNLRKLIDLMKIFCHEKCDGFWRAKCYFVTILQLIRWNIKFKVIVQEPLEIVVTHNHGMHQIFNPIGNFSFARNLILSSYLHYYEEYACECPPKKIMSRAAPFEKHERLHGQNLCAVIPKLEWFHWFTIMCTGRTMETAKFAWQQSRTQVQQHMTQELADPSMKTSLESEILERHPCQGLDSSSPIPNFNVFLSIHFKSHSKPKMSHDSLRRCNKLLYNEILTTHPLACQQIKFDVVYISKSGQSLKIHFESEEMATIFVEILQQKFNVTHFTHIEGRQGEIENKRMASRIEKQRRRNRSRKYKRNSTRNVAAVAPSFQNK